MWEGAGGGGCSTAKYQSRGQNGRLKIFRLMIMNVLILFFFSCWNVKLNTQHICNGAQISFTEHRVSMLSLGVAGAHSGYFIVIKAPGGQGC